MAAAAATALGGLRGTAEAYAGTTLAAPKIIGPVTTISPSVRVDNALRGATVNLFAEGASPPIASVPASPDGVTLIPAGGLGLKADQRLIATQTANGTSGEASPVETVQAPPNPLPAVHCASLVHACMDWLVVTGAVPGATVKVRYAGIVVGEAVCDWPDWSRVSVLLDKGRTGPFGLGSALEVWQHYVDPVTKALVSGPVTASPLVVASPVSPPLPAPQFQRAPRQCDMEVDVTGVVPGASLRVTVDSTNLDYPYVGDTIRCAVGSLSMGTSVHLYQRFHTGCSGESRTTDATAAAAIPYEKPAVHARVCEESGVLFVSKLHRGAQIVAYATEDVKKSGVEIGAWTASQDGDDWFPLSSSARDTVGKPNMLVFVQVSNCTGAITQSPHSYVDFSAPNPDIAIGPLYDCGTLVEVRGTSPNALVWLTAGGKSLSTAVPAISDTTMLRCFRPLVAGEVVTANESGCGGAASKTASAKVDKKALGTPVVRTPLEAWRTDVPVDGVVPGALVSVYVNGVWRGAREATSSSVEVPAGRLTASAAGRPDRVHAVQQLCAETKAGPDVDVTYGKMTLDTDPNPVVTGATRTVKVLAKNAADGRPVVGGRVWIGGKDVAAANTAFPWTFPAGQPGPATYVRADGYLDAPLTWHLTDPVNATLTMLIGVHTAQTTINSVSWKLVEHTSGVTVATPTGPTAKVALPPPPADQEVVTYDLYCTVDLTGLDNRHHMVSITAPDPGVAYIGWRGADLTAAFWMDEQAHLNPQTGTYVVDADHLILVSVQPT